MEIKKSKIIRDFGIILLGILVSAIAPLGLNIIFLGLILALTDMYWAGKPKTKLPDERDKRILEKAGYNAFWVMILVMWIILMPLYEPHVYSKCPACPENSEYPIYPIYPTYLGSMGLLDAVFIVLVVGISTLLILHFYYRRKGERI